MFEIINGVGLVLLLNAAPVADYSKIKGATPASIAVNEQVRHEVHGTRGIFADCADLNVFTNKCRIYIPRDAGNDASK